jgi:co-chaperonin GroES (HSP10)
LKPLPGRILAKANKEATVFMPESRCEGTVLNVGDAKLTADGKREEMPLKKGDKIKYRMVRRFQSSAMLGSFMLMAMVGSCE